MDCKQKGAARVTACARPMTHSGLLPCRQRGAGGGRSSLLPAFPSTISACAAAATASLRCLPEPGASVHMLLPVNVPCPGTRTATACAACPPPLLHPACHSFPNVTGAQHNSWMRRWCAYRKKGRYSGCSRTGLGRGYVVGTGL